jgi:hypothetical protein
MSHFVETQLATSLPTVAQKPSFDTPQAEMLQATSLRRGVDA